MRWALAIVAALLVVLTGLVVALFVVQNSGHTAELSLELPYPPRRWLFVNPSTGSAPPVLLLMGLSFLGGLGVGVALLGWQWLRFARRFRALRQELTVMPSPLTGVSAPSVPVPRTNPSLPTRPSRPTANPPVSEPAASPDVDAAQTSQTTLAKSVADS